MSQPDVTNSPAPAGKTKARKRPRKVGVSLRARGEPMIWLTGGALVICIAMIAGLLGLVLYQGFATFWPGELLRYELRDGQVLMGELAREETHRPDESMLAGLAEDEQTVARDLLGKSEEGVLARRLVRTGNYDITRTHFHWVEDFQVARTEAPEWAAVVERMEWGRFYGWPIGFKTEGQMVTEDPAEVWSLYRENIDEVIARRAEITGLEKHEIGAINRRLEDMRLALRQVALDEGEDSAAWQAKKAEYDRLEVSSKEAFSRISVDVDALRQENARHVLVMKTVDGSEVDLHLADVVRAYLPNRMSTGDRIGVYLDRWWEFLADEPREANSEGGVFPAIFGTVSMTLIMCLIVAPFGVLAALYLREYAKKGPLVSAVRIAINNLAGVPSIVFGVFGLGFFCYIVGGSIDEVFFEAKLPSPTYGTGGILWASLTLALLTLPVVIVATEEALSAVPNSMREGSYACGASKWQTIRRIVLPRAMPGIMTGMILAMARGAGEVAPLMLVGAVKLAPELPIDSVAPFLHPERSFMHLGFHIYDLGFQSQNSEAAKPMVFTTTLLLITIIACLNIGAIFIRSRLRRKFNVSQF
ncbi:MAG: phosphate ABC transporter permease PstA [Planctomycetes bacterium]|nr:phosphate ABC transporter permease PstA [Planctomycetota bacterium]